MTLQPTENVRSGSGMFSENLTMDNTFAFLSPQQSEAKNLTQHTTTKTKKFLASHRNMHGPKVENFIKTHSLGQRTFMNNRKVARDNSAS